MVVWSNAITRNTELYDGSQLWEITLSDINTNYINPTDFRTRVSIAENLMKDVAGNGNVAKSFLFKYDVVKPTLVISAQRVDDGNNVFGAINQSGKYKFTDNVLFTFTLTEANPYDNTQSSNPFENSNIIDEQSQLVKKFEEMIKSVENSKMVSNESDFSNEEEEMIKEELRKMGYS